MGVLSTLHFYCFYVISSIHVSTDSICCFQARLSAIISRIETNLAIDTLNDECTRLVNEFTTLDLTTRIPGCGPKERRCLLKEGSLKLKDSSMRVRHMCYDSTPFTKTFY